MNDDTRTTNRNDWRHTPLSRVPKDDDGTIGGVIAGIARAYGFDLRTTRIAFAVATLILPVLAAVYVVAWLVLPDRPSEARTIDQLLHDRARYPLYAVVGLVLVVGVLGSFGSWFLYRGAPWGFVLIGLGVLLWMSTGERFASRRRTATAGGTAAPAAQAFGATATSTTPFPSPAAPGVGFPPPTPGPAGAADADATPTIASPATVTADLPVMATTTAELPLTVGASSVGAPAPAPAARTRRRRVPITSIGAGVMVLWFAVVGIGNALDWWHVDNLWVVVAGMGIVLTAMLVSIVVNRSWVLPFLFFPLLFVLVMLCVAQPDIDGPSGQRTVRPTTVAEATTRQHLATGQLTLDLRDVPLDGGTVTVDAEVGLGRLHVLVPRDADIDLRTEVGAGQAELGDEELSSGVRHTTEVSVRQDGVAAGTIVLDLRVGMGQIDVERVAPDGITVERIDG